MQLEKLSSCFEGEWLKFTASKMMETKVLWLNKQYQGVDCNSAVDLHEEFRLNFSYGIADTTCFESMNFDLDDTKEFLAERYGGFGLAQNGGGVRCGTIANYQLKGIGMNCLVGDHDDVTHSYGGLDAPLAVAETIYSNLFSNIFPLGAVKVYGLILTGEQTAIDPTTGQPCWGVIMVREACIRPAHFLPASAFLPHPKYRYLFKSDSARTRHVNKTLTSVFKSHNQYVMFLGKYLNRCANQFAFARAARIMHSTLTASNISMDGRWLDVPLSSFLTAGSNNALSSAFYTEPIDALNIALEMLNTYSKINNILLSGSPLIAYFNEQLDSYFSFHVGFVLHLPAKRIIEENKIEWETVSSFIGKIIKSGKDLDRTRASFTFNDPIVNLILGMFLSLLDSDYAVKFLFNSKLKSDDVSKLLPAFKKIINSGFKIEEDQYVTYINYVTCRVIVALKRAICSGLYYLSEVEREARSMCGNGKPTEISSMIDAYGSISHWVYCENSTESIILFESDKLSVSYFIFTYVYKVTICNDGVNFCSIEFNSYTNLYNYLTYEINSDLLVIFNFDFSKYFLTLNKVIPFVNNNFNVKC